MTLTVTDDEGATASRTQIVTIGAPPNQAPSASFSVNCIILDCSVDASASADPDGQIAGYTWDFGDGGSSTGRIASHTYVNAGTFAIKLRVTDDDGATNETTNNATPTPPTALAADAFGRTASNAWGNLDSGGSWTISGSASQYSVLNGKGQFRIGAPGGAPRAFLTTLDSANTDLVTSISIDKPATGTGLYVYSIGRRIVGSGEYRAISRFSASGTVSLGLARLSPTGAATSIQPETTVPGLTMTPGEELNVRVRVTGVNPTIVSARAWKKGSAEPPTWFKTTTDSTAALQAPGGIGFQTYLSGGATNAPVVVAFDDVRAMTP